MRETTSRTRREPFAPKRTHRESHEEIVHNWMDAHGSALTTNLAASTERLLSGLQAIWDRACPVLGDGALTAILSRVHDTALLRYPELESLGLILSVRMGMTTPPPPRVDLTPGSQFLLVEALLVLDGLSSGALTPALHGALTPRPLAEW